MPSYYPGRYDQNSAELITQKMKLKYIPFVQFYYAETDLVYRKKGLTKMLVEVL